MKVFWSKNRGCVIGSANASSNALGRSGLKETGIWLPSGAVDIKRLIRYSDPREIQEADLRRLDRESRERSKNTTEPRKTRPAPDFVQWYSSPHRTDWKIGCVGQEVVGVARAVKEQSYAEYGHKEPHGWVSCGQSRVRRNDWILVFVDTERGAKAASWLYVDFIVKVSRKKSDIMTLRFHSMPFK
jgi:hypothetical protein